jgi:glycine betaine/choline ABC-type transport system substrate-binding protein
MGTDAVASVSKKTVHSKAIKHVANKLKDGVVNSANYVANTSKDDANDVAQWFKHIHW